MKNMQNLKYSLILLVALVIVGSATAQERYFDTRYIYTQAFLNPVLINPGASGFGNNQLLFNYRNNWASFAGNPNTITLAYDGQLIDRVGFGAVVMQDNFGSLRTNKAQVSFSYGITTPTNKVRFGIATDFLQHGLNNRDADDSQFNPNDPLVRLRREGAQFFEVSIGAYGIYDNRLTYGIALPSLLSSRINYTDKVNTNEIGFIFNVGYKLDAVPDEITLEPSIFVKKLQSVPTHVDINLKAGFMEDKLTGGVSYTLGADKRLGFLLGFKINKADIYYTYNVSTWAFQNYNNGAHEVSVKLNLGAILTK